MSRFGKEGMSRDSVFAALKKKGVAKAEVYYSGGNDEGGVNDIALLDAAGKNVGNLQEYYGAPQTWDEATQRWVSAPDTPTDDNRLAEALGAPVYDNYGGFAGEFYVSGTVTWDVEKRTVKDHGVEEVSHDEDFDRDL
jgi:hypothetical protein